MKRLLMVLALCLTSCAPPPTPNNPTTEPSGLVPVFVAPFVLTGVYRAVDEAAGVACWVSFFGEGSGAISCLPIEDTELGGAK